MTLVPSGILAAIEYDVKYSSCYILLMFGAREINLIKRYPNTLEVIYNIAA